MILSLIGHGAEVDLKSKCTHTHTHKYTHSLFGVFKRPLALLKLFYFFYKCRSPHFIVKSHPTNRERQERERERVGEK